MEEVNTVKIKQLRDYPELLECTAAWFCAKWQIPYDAYYTSIQDCLKQTAAIPQWYVAVNEQNKIVAGAGVIENDFHDRKDLTPNLCALYVEKNNRQKGIARLLLNFIRKDMCQFGFTKLYLVTDHTSFYEKCGWDYLTMVRDNDGLEERLYVATTI